jgi:hypothetical protein
MRMNVEQMIEKFLEKVEDILYQDDKFSDKNIAEILVKILEKEYDI